jgi:UDP-GlcNAc3NAcA epimerase
VENLKSENIIEGVSNIGDVMYDAVIYNAEIAKTKSNILSAHSLNKDEYYLITIHRAENTDDRERLENILNAFEQIPGKKVWPIHPRTKKMIADYGFNLNNIKDLQIIEPVGYLDMLTLEVNAKKIITDSGGVQKEHAKVPCLQS